MADEAYSRSVFEFVHVYINQLLSNRICNPVISSMRICNPIYCFSYINISD